MAGVKSLPARGAVFLDPRGESRALRVSWHQQDGLVVISLWRVGTCVGTFRLALADVPTLIGALVDGLAADHPEPSAGPFPP